MWSEACGLQCAEFTCHSTVLNTVGADRIMPAHIGTLAGTNAAIVKMGFSFSPVSGWCVAEGQKCYISPLRIRKLLVCTRKHCLGAPQLRIRDVVPLPLRKLLDLAAGNLEVLAGAPVNTALCRQTVAWKMLVANNNID